MLGFYRTYTTPFKEEIPTLVDEFLLRVSLPKRFLRFFGRYLYAEFFLRKSKRQEVITEQQKRILWIQWVDSYLGDSLMDLSSRVLLEGKKVDLLTKEYTAKIFDNDTVFNCVFTDSSQLNPDDYDLLIIDSYRESSLGSFVDRLSHIPHVTLYGYYNVDNFNRLYFSFFRINQLLLNPCSEQHIKNTAKPLLPITLSDKATVDKICLPNEFITIAIGGVWKERTFHNWQGVIDTLLAKGVIEKIVLVGAKDAEEESKIICKQHHSNTINAVGKCTFNQTAEVISRSKLLICADGGLTHAANAVLTPVVCLFHELDPSVRLIEANKSIGIMDETCIDNISINHIIEQVETF